MKVTLFGATGLLGRECLSQCLESGHDVTVLLRTPDKLPAELRAQVTVIEGDGLGEAAVARALPPGTDAVLFAIGIDARSPEDLCTDVTRHILTAMRKNRIRRLVWCGGGNTVGDEDVVSLGSRFVVLFTRCFMGLRHRDKLHQVALLDESRDVDWVGIRPLQMRKGAPRGGYRVGFDRYSGFSKITAGDCASEMIHMLEDDTWLHKAPVVQY